MKAGPFAKLAVSLNTAVCGNLCSAYVFPPFIACFMANARAFVGPQFELAQERALRVPTSLPQLSLAASSRSLAHSQQISAQTREAWVAVSDHCFMHAKWTALASSATDPDADQAPSLYGHSLNAVTLQGHTVLVAFGGTQSGGPDSQVCSQQML